MILIEKSLLFYFAIFETTFDAMFSQGKSTEISGSAAGCRRERKDWCGSDPLTGSARSAPMRVDGLAPSPA
jgi:hypothetical protein